ncbi:MAG: glutamine--tRNA ligase/YqeY domain fusion protein [Bacteroidia bacterium]
MSSNLENSSPGNFIEEIVREDLKSGKHTAIQTRFPPEPNGYLHIGHAKAICLDFGLAQQFGGKCNLRFDDTNPTKEETRYVDGIKEDIQWLGFQWDAEYYASDYFPQLYEWAVELIKKGLAYVDDTPQEEMSRQRGVPTRPGEESVHRNSSVERNLDLFERMKNGEFDEGTYVLRGKVDMASPNMQMRDPVLYRILKKHHHRTGDQWVIYPTYDYAHGQSDSIEKVTHSICTLEFEVHRPLYEWFIDKLGIFPSRQIEFSRLNLSYVVMSKRRLLRLVTEGYVSDWDDPRMPTICGLRRRGYTPASLRNLAERVGVTKVKSVTDYSLLEFLIREDLNKIATRAMAVLDPLKLVITNWEEGRKEQMEIENNPEDPASGNRMVPFGKELWIERDDFEENPPKGYFRLAPGLEVRLKGAYIVQCTDFVKDADGNVTEVHCTYDSSSRSGQDTSGKKVKGTIHWVSVADAVDVEVRQYDRLFSVEDPDGESAAQDKDFVEFINPNSLVVIPNAKAEPSLGQANLGDRFQFMRKGYFVVDPDSTDSKKVFNLTVNLRDTWAKSK